MDIRHNQQENGRIRPEESPCELPASASLAELANLEALEITSDRVTDALVVIDACFPNAADRQAALETYRRYADGNRCYLSAYQERTVRLLEYSVFYKQRAPVGVVGLYQLEGDSKRLYMGWFGVLPEHRKSSLPAGEIPVSASILRYTEALARSLGAEELAAFTEDGESNRRAQAFYERNGFTVTERFERRGEPERVYTKALGFRSDLLLCARSPWRSDLSSSP